MAYTTINDPTKYFNTVIYTGNGTDDHAITGVGFQPDFIWQKNRTDAVNHGLFDTVRGIGGGSNTKRLASNDNSSEDEASNTVKSVDSDGFTLGTNPNLNGSSDSNVAWNWLAGGTASSNTDGSITASVSASTTSGFSIVSFTGNGTSGATVGHGLGAVPKFIIVKRRDTTGRWQTYHVGRSTSTPENQYGFLDGDEASASATNRWNDTAPTSSVFSLGNSTEVNASGGTYVAYVFANVQGFARFGRYSGNNSSDGSLTYLGFKPALLIIKRHASTGDWVIKDNKRSGTSALQNFGQMNPNQTQHPTANNTNAENKASAFAVDILSNGFKLRGTDADINASATYLYWAVAEAPFVTSTGIPTTAR